MDVDIKIDFTWLISIVKNLLSGQELTMVVLDCSSDLEKENDGHTRTFYIGYSFGTTKKGRTKAVLASHFHKSNINTNHFPTP